MMRHTFVAGLLGLTLTAYSTPMVYAEDLDVKIDRMQIKEDKEDLAESRLNVTKWEQTFNERRAERDKVKANYEDSLSKKGAKSKLTKEAKDRYESAERATRRAERKLAKAQETLREDETELNQAYQELNKNKRD